MSQIFRYSAQIIVIFEPNVLNNRLMIYNWQQPDWPEFRYDLQGVENTLFDFAEQTGHVSGILSVLPEDIRMEAIIATMVSEAIKTSEIEGEHLDRLDIISSIRNNLGLNETPEPVKDRESGGAGELHPSRTGHAAGRLFRGRA